MSNSESFLQGKSRQAWWKLKCFSDFNMQMNFLGILLKCGFWVSRFGVGPNILYSCRLAGDVWVLVYRLNQLQFWPWEWLRAIWGWVLWSSACCVVERGPWPVRELHGWAALAYWSAAQGLSWTLLNPWHHCIYGSRHELGDLWGFRGLIPQENKRAVL